MRLGSATRTLSLSALAAVAGCSSAQGGGGSVVAGLKGTLVLHSGGQGDETTASFSSKTSGIVIDYQLTQASSRPEIVFSVEQDGGNGVYSPASTVSRPISGTQGSASLALNPGNYRIRVETDVPWTADIYESKP